MKQIFRTRQNQRTHHRLLAIAFTVLLLASLSACQMVQEITLSPTPTAVPTVVPTEVPDYLERAYAGEYAGKKVLILGSGADIPTNPVTLSVASFEEETGIDIIFIESSDFAKEIIDRTKTNNFPHIANFPQPGLLASLASEGYIIDLNQHISQSHFEKQYIAPWLEMGTMEGPEGPIMAGVWHRVFGKSQVWYPKKVWQAEGYSEPETWAEMIELMDEMVADGYTPWCIGIESGDSTGWVATDWLEEIMLRTHSAETYDAWVRGDLPFSSPEVREAMETLSEIWLNDAYVYNGRDGILNTSALNSPSPMFQNPPQCLMHKQANFILGYFPAGTTGTVDYDAFPLPYINPMSGYPYLVSGDLFAAFSDEPEALAVMKYLTLGESLKEWMAIGGVLSPHNDAESFWYQNPSEAKISYDIAVATAVRFDGSDLMPRAVGADAFWAGMTDYISGAKDLDTVLAEIDAAWPEDMRGDIGDNFDR